MAQLSPPKRRRSFGGIWWYISIARLDGIYYCPHFPKMLNQTQNAKYTIECSCRKPKTGMIDRAVLDLNVDASKSFFIGDSPSDIQCGRDAGMVTICVRTGNGCEGSEVEPDHYFQDLFEAVEFVVFGS